MAIIALAIKLDSRGPIFFHQKRFGFNNERIDVLRCFGISYASMNATDMRTELDARFDDSTLLYGKPLIWSGRAAWAHDFVGNPALITRSSLAGRYVHRQRRAGPA